MTYKKHGIFGLAAALVAGCTAGDPAPISAAETIGAAATEYTFVDLRSEIPFP